MWGSEPSYTSVCDVIGKIKETPAYVAKNNPEYENNNKDSQDPAPFRRCSFKWYLHH